MCSVFRLYVVQACARPAPLPSLPALPFSSGPSFRRASFLVRARPPESWTQLLGMPPDILDHTPPLFLTAHRRLGRSVHLDQLWSHASQAIVERAPSVLDRGQRELETTGELHVGVAENRLSQQLLLGPRETEPRRRLDERGRHGTTEIRGHLLPRDAE